MGILADKDLLPVIWLGQQHSRSDDGDEDLLVQVWGEKGGKERGCGEGNGIFDTMCHNIYCFCNLLSCLKYYAFIYD